MLTEDDFKSFFLFKNNRHWTGLHRIGNVICSDMPRVRKALSILLDESPPIEKRLDTLFPKKGPAFVPRLGKAILTGILHVEPPNRYGVYNGTSEAGLKALGAWPSIGRGDPFSARYLAEKCDSVHGIIIAHEADKKNRYALMYTKQVDLMCYKVDFQLCPVTDEVGGKPE